MTIENISCSNMGGGGGGGGGVWGGLKPRPPGLQSDGASKPPRPAVIVFSTIDNYCQ